MHLAIVCKTLSLVTAVVTAFQILPMLWSLHDAASDLNPFLASPTRAASRALDVRVRVARR